MSANVEVLLLSDVKDLGKAGQVVSVSAGYARNKLIPQNLADKVTEAAKRRLAKLQAERAAKAAEEKAAAQALAAKLNGLSVNVSAKTVDGKKLYGSVSSSDILMAIQADRNVELDKSQLDMPEVLKEIGSYNAALRLAQGVVVPFKVTISEEA